MNPSTTALTLNMQLPNIATVSWAVQGDTLSREITATLVDGSTAWNPQAGYHGVVRAHKPDGTNCVYDVDEDGNPAVTWTGNVATVKIVQQALTVAGTVLMQLEFYDQNDARVTAFGWANNVQPSAVTDTEFLSTDYYNILSLQIAGVLGASGHPPYINSTSLNWMIWDENSAAYVDSGFSSVGTVGPAPVVTSTAYTYANSNSGTVVPSVWYSVRPATSPGTWQWTKTVVTFDNNTVTTLYNVAYQGQDGQGSPGYSTPLMDGTAAVGTANAYAREDHRHPSDSKKVFMPKYRKILVIGDSWCSSWDGTADLTPWATRMATATGATVDNHAFPGSGFVAKGSSNKDFSDAIQDYPSGGYDAIIVQGGVNDITANPSAATVSTAVASFATECVSLYPDADIYYIATAPCRTLTVAEMNVLNSLVQSATANYITVCTSVFGIGVADSSYKGDGTHLSDDGYTELARCVWQFLTGGDSMPQKPLLYKQKYTSLLARQTVSGSGSISLLADVSAFDALVVTVYNGSGTADSKSFFIPNVAFGNRNDVSWNATDSVSWYAIMTLTFSGTSMNVNKFQVSGFTTMQISVYGINLT